MTLALPPEDMAAASYSQSTNMYTVTDSSGQKFQMTEESFEEFISKMGLTIEDLDFYRGQVIGGSVTRLREGANPEYMNSGSLRDVDTVNLPFGGFDDAKRLAESYKAVVYPGRAEQIDRVFHGLDTGRVISEDIKTSYLQNDGNISADVASVQNEFETRGGDVTQSDVDEVRGDNASEETPGAENEPAPDEEQPRTL
jgi:hypothetical protein